jgi:alpha/beta superfamily hydrolase
MTDDRAARPAVLETEDGERLEAAWSGPIDATAVAVLTHPHPRFGGDMHNLVPASLARSLPEHGIATLRFGFRGTGRSTGTHSGGDAEVLDVRAAVASAAGLADDITVVGVGYSFGADVLLALDDPALRAVVAVAPPLSALSNEQFARARGRASTLVLAPQHDQFRSPDDTRTVVDQWPNTSFRTISGADHFLAGQMGNVTDEVVDFLRPILSLP